MKVKDVMTADVECVGPDGSLQEAAMKMKARDVGPVLVCEGDTVAGIVTDRDIVVRAVAEGRDTRTTRVQEVMTRDLVFVREDDDVKEAARRMKDHQVRRVVVLTRDGKLAGIVSTKDIAVDTGDKKLAGDVLREVSEDAAVAGKR
jgi:CBS domain-containing protein